jgi:hypothetical protein
MIRIAPATDIAECVSAAARQRATNGQRNITTGTQSSGELEPLARANELALASEVAIGRIKVARERRACLDHSSRDDRSVSPSPPCSAGADTVRGSIAAMQSPGGDAVESMPVWSLKKSG